MSLHNVSLCGVVVQIKVMMASSFPRLVYVLILRSNGALENPKHFR